MIYYNGIVIDRKLRLIRHKGKWHQWDVRLKRNYRFETVVYLLLSEGASKEMVFWHLYKDDPEGGPLDSTKVISIIINKVAKDELKRLGLTVRSWKIAGVSYYEIVPADQAVITKRFSDTRAGSFVQRSGQALDYRVTKGIIAAE